MPNNPKIVRFEIDGVWTVSELERFVSYLDLLYHFRVVIHKSLNPLNLRKTFSVISNPIRKLPFDRDYLISFVKDTYPNIDFRVQRLQYSSPGFTDFAGIGAIVGHIKDFFLRLIEYKMMAERHNIENQRIRLESERVRLDNDMQLMKIDEQMLNNAKLRYDNVERFLAVTGIGTESADIGTALHVLNLAQSEMIQLVAEGKITNVSLRDSEQPSSKGPVT